MDELPSIKTHPILMSLVTVTFVLGVLVLGLIGGWFLRAMSESRAELAVVVDDGNFMQALEVQTQKWIEQYNQFDEDFHNDHTEIPECVANPMPNYYHDADYIMQPNGESEE